MQHREGLRVRDMCGVDELHHYGMAAADSWEVVERWVQDRFGLPQSRLGATFPVHVLFTAPPAFPLEPSFRQHMSRVLGLEA